MKFTLYLLCFLLVVGCAVAQNNRRSGGQRKNSNRKRVIPEHCKPFQKKTLELLIVEPPNLPKGTDDFLACLPQTLVTEFTARDSKHVKAVVDCLDEALVCTEKGYKQIAVGLQQIVIKITRCTPTCPDDPRIDRLLKRLRTLNGREFHRGTKILIDKGLLTM